MKTMNSLINKAAKLRQDTFLAFIKKGEANLGGSFSIIEILITLFYKILKKEDKFILSKSHASFPLCLILKKKGYNPKLTTHLEIDPKNKIAIKRTLIANPRCGSFSILTNVPE